MGELFTLIKCMIPYWTITLSPTTLQLSVVQYLLTIQEMEMINLKITLLPIQTLKITVQKWVEQL